jgi:hypothetical protein
MESKLDYYRTSPEYVKLKLGDDKPEKPVALAKAELAKMITFLFLGLGCLGVTAYVYTQSKMTAKETHEILLQNRTGQIHPMAESQRPPLFFKPCHVIVIRFHSPISYFTNIIKQLDQEGPEKDDRVALATNEAEIYPTSESTATRTSDSSSPSSSWITTSSPFRVHPADWLQDQLNWLQGQMNWLDTNLGLRWFPN